MKLKHLLLGRKAMNNLLLLLNHFSRVRLCVTSAHQAPPPLRFSRQEHWSGLPFPSPMNNLDSILKSRDITLPRKVHLVKDMVFLLVMYGCESSDHKEGWAPKNWCFWTVVLEKILESPLDCKEIQPVHPKGNQSWIFIGKTAAEALILWPADVKNWLTRKTLMLGKIEGRRRG